MELKKKLYLRDANILANQFRFVQICQILKEGIRIVPLRVRAPSQGPEIGKTSPRIVFYNPRSSIKPGSASDPEILIIYG